MTSLTTALITRPTTSFFSLFRPPIIQLHHTLRLQPGCCCHVSSSIAPIIHPGTCILFTNPQTSCIMHRARHCIASSIVANGKRAAEQQLKPSGDSPQVATRSLLFLPTSPFCHLNTLRLKVTFCCYGVCVQTYAAEHIFQAPEQERRSKWADVRA